MCKLHEEISAKTKAWKLTDLTFELEAPSLACKCFDFFVLWYLSGAKRNIRRMNGCKETLGNHFKSKLSEQLKYWSCNMIKPVNNAHGNNAFQITDCDVLIRSTRSISVGSLQIHFPPEALTIWPWNFHSRWRDLILRGLQMRIWKFVQHLTIDSIHFVDWLLWFSKFWEELSNH